MDADKTTLIGEKGSMPRKLSSPFQTWAHRVSAILGIALAVFLFPSMALPAGSSIKLLFALWVIFFLYGCIQTFRLKTVELDGDHLLISNFGDQARVPLTAISAVKGGRGGRNPIQLEFRIATEFGESIKFRAPRRRSLWPWQQHPLVTELKTLCKLDTQPL
jgi:hypothetical protein